jgi:hypothetical protein
MILFPGSIVKQNSTEKFGHAYQVQGFGGHRQAAMVVEANAKAADSSAQLWH